MVFRVRFDEDVREERAHVDPKKPGFRIVTIPKGTERTMNRASLEHHRARGRKIVVLAETPDLTPFEQSAGGFAPSTDSAVQPLTKTRVREAVDAATAAVQARDNKALIAALKSFLTSELGDVLPDLDSDTRMLLDAALEDLQDDRFDVHPDEFAEALMVVRNMTLPPSKRK